MAVLESKYTVKTSIIGKPKVHLRANVGKLLYGDGSYAWTMSSDSYIKETINNADKRIKEDSLEYNKKLSDVNYSPKNIFIGIL